MIFWKAANSSIFFSFVSEFILQLRNMYVYTYVYIEFI